MCRFIVLCILEACNVPASQRTLHRKAVNDFAAYFVAYQIPYIGLVALVASRLNCVGSLRVCIVMCWNTSMAHLNSGSVWQRHMSGMQSVWQTLASFASVRLFAYLYIGWSSLAIGNVIIFNLLIESYVIVFGVLCNMLLNRCICQIHRSAVRLLHIIIWRASGSFLLCRTSEHLQRGNERGGRTQSAKQNVRWNCKAVVQGKFVMPCCARLMILFCLLWL